MPSPLESILALINQPSAQGGPDPNAIASLLSEPEEAQAAREAAALRLKRGAMPEGGRQEGPFTQMVSDPASMGKALFGATPPGMMMNMYEAGRRGDMGEMAANALGAGVGPAVGRGVGAVARALQGAPKTAAATLGAAGAGLTASAPGDAEALTPQQPGIPLTPAQQRQAARETQKLETKTKDEAAKRDHENVLRAIEAKRLAGETDTNTEIARKKAEADFAAAEKTRQANLPFREKYPDLTKWLPAIGGAGAFATPYLLRAGGRMAENAATKLWQDAAKTAAISPTPQNIATLKNFQKGANVPDSKIGIGGLLGGAAEPIVASSTPDINDIMFNPDPKNQEAAKARLMDPARIVASLLEGGAAGWTGYKFPMMLPSRVPPAAASQGIIDAAKNAAAAVTKARNAASKSKKKSD